MESSSNSRMQKEKRTAEKKEKREEEEERKEEELVKVMQDAFFQEGLAAKMMSKISKIKQAFDVAGRDAGKRIERRRDQARIDENSQEKEEIAGVRGEGRKVLQGKSRGWPNSRMQKEKRTAEK